jgi:hypothetical protein
MNEYCFLCLDSDSLTVWALPVLGCARPRNCTMCMNCRSQAAASVCNGGGCRYIWRRQRKKIGRCWANGKCLRIRVEGTRYRWELRLSLRWQKVFAGTMFWQWWRWHDGKDWLSQRLKEAASLNCLTYKSERRKTTDFIYSRKAMKILNLGWRTIVNIHYKSPVAMQVASDSSYMSLLGDLSITLHSILAASLDF